MKRLLPLPLAIAILALINVLGAVLIVTRIEFNNAPELYFPATAPSVRLDNEIKKEFPNDELLIGLFIGENLYSDHFLKSLDALTKRMEAHPLIDRVFSVTNVDHITASDDGFTVERLLDPDELSGTTPEQRMQRVLADRFAPGLLTAKDGSALAVVVRPKYLDQSRQREEVQRAFHLAVKEVGLAGQLYALAGPMALDVAQLQSMLQDGMFLTPLTTIFGLQLLFWVVGRFPPVVIGMVALSTVVVGAIALLVILNRPYTLVSAMIPPLMAGYTLATLLHLYAALQRARKAGLRRPYRVLRAVQEIHTPALFNVLTTGAGMLSLVLTPIPPIQDFALIGTIGTVLVYVVVYHLVPPLLAKWDKGRWPQQGSGLRWTRKLSYGLASLSIRHAGWVIFGVLVVIAALLPWAARVVVETDLYQFFPEDHQLTKSTRLVEAKLTGVMTLEIIVDAEGRDGLKDPARLKALKQVQLWAEGLPEVDRSMSMMDLIEEMNWAFNNEDPAYRRLPDDPKLLSQLLLIYDGRDLHELVNREFQRTRILLNLNVHGANEIQAVIDKIEAHLAGQSLPGVKWQIGSFGRMFADQEDLLVLGQQRSFLGAFGQILLLLIILWRSLPAAMICLVPNLAPLYFIFVVMGAVGITLDMATVLIASVVLGITVDDTIHLYHSYLKRRRNGHSPIFALARSFEATGRAVLAIFAVLVVQFAILLGSRFQPTADFGLLASIGLLAGQLLELLMLPALIVLWSRYGPKREVMSV